MAGYSITPVDLSDITATDLRREIIRAGDPRACYRVRTLDDDGCIRSAPIGQVVLWSGGRAAVCWGGDSTWVDAGSPEEALAAVEQEVGA